MYIYKLRQKSTGLFLAGFDSRMVPQFTKFGSIYTDKSNFITIKWDIKNHRKGCSWGYVYAKKHNPKRAPEYAEEAISLRPNNFEVVTYFCTEHSVTKP